LARGFALGVTRGRSAHGSAADAGAIEATNEALQSCAPMLDGSTAGGVLRSITCRLTSEYGNVILSNVNGAALDHDDLVTSLTGGLVPTADIAPFAGSERLRPDGRPRPELRAELRRIPDLRNAALVLFVAAYPVLVIWAAVTVDHPVGWVVAFVVMGAYFQRLLTLFHEAAHRLLFSNRRLNDLVGEQLIGWLAFGDGSNRYRKAHAQHHRDEFGPGEPDFALYARYPIERASFRRKLVRDATGVSGGRTSSPCSSG
jgi:hypothetical protein